MLDIPTARDDILTDVATVARVTATAVRDVDGALQLRAARALQPLAEAVQAGLRKVRADTRLGTALRALEAKRDTWWALAHLGAVDAAWWPTVGALLELGVDGPGVAGALVDGLLAEPVLSW